MREQPPEVCAPSSPRSRRRPVSEWIPRKAARIARGRRIGRSTPRQGMTSPPWVTGRRRAARTGRSPDREAAPVADRYARAQPGSAV